MTEPTYGELELVSCVILSYKKFDLIYNAIDSVIKQDYRRIELIICDDGSPYFPREDIEKYVRLNRSDCIERVIIHRNENNIGTVANLNTAVSLSTGKYIVCLANDDTFYDEATVTRIFDEFKKTGARIISCRREYIDSKTGNSLIVLPTDSAIKRINRMTPRQLFNEQAKLSIFIAGTYMTREAMLAYSDKTGSYKYVEDHSMFLRCSREGERIHMADFISIKYRFGDGISTSGLKSFLLDDQISIYRNEVLAYKELLTSVNRNYAEFNFRRLMLKKRGKTKLFDAFVLCLKYPVGAVVHLSVIYSCRHMIKRVKRAQAGPVSKANAEKA